MTAEVPHREQVGYGYSRFQLARALTALEAGINAAERERARARVEKWVSVINGMSAKSLDIGSDTPVDGVPTWVTLEVATGGFATGRLLAGGPLQPHELALASRLDLLAGNDVRLHLNLYYLSEPGLAELSELLSSGCYRVNVPEESALLAVAWLSGNGYAESSRTLVSAIAPFFARLRFFPHHADMPAAGGTRVFLQPVSDTLAALGKVRDKQQILRQKEAVLVWLPLYDRLVALFLETVEGEPPITINKAGVQQTSGGWPCMNFSADWRKRAGEFLSEVEAAAKGHQLCRKPGKTKLSFAQLLGFLKRALDKASDFTPIERGRMRLILGRYHSKHGLPGSDKLTAERAMQKEQVDRPSHKELAFVLEGRLKALTPDEGIEDTSAALQDFSTLESETYHIRSGNAIPKNLARKVRRSSSEDIDTLVETGVITSAETLARVLPRLTSVLRSVGISDESLRRLYSLNYQAFSRRRSLLLLDLKSQVKISALPWVSAMDKLRIKESADPEPARQALSEITVLTFRHFPQAIIPNKLLQEMRTLVKSANLKIILTDELAADIFMGRFSDKFTEAAKASCAFLDKSLYSRYFAIRNREIQALESKMNEAAGGGKQPGFWGFLLPRAVPAVTQAGTLAQICARRAGVTLGGWKPAKNGMIIEQQQILTSHNLSALFEGLGLGVQMSPYLETICRQVFTWILKRLQVKASRSHARLIAVKNAAYAWRQMLFYLSQLSSTQLREFLSWCSEQLAKEPEEFQSLFYPVIKGLELAAAGAELEQSLLNETGSRVFLGWSEGGHWLIHRNQDRR